jgi:ABC-2 type transport system permease protein
VIVGTGIALGWSPSGGLVAALGLILLGTVAFAGIGMLLAGTLRAEANLAVANGLFLVLLFLGGMAYPLDRLPDALEAFARLLPAAALSETLRGALDAQAEFRVGELGVLVVWAIAAPLAAARWFPTKVVRATGPSGDRPGKALHRLRGGNGDRRRPAQG